MSAKIIFIKKLTTNIQYIYANISGFNNLDTKREEKINIKLTKEEEKTILPALKPIPQTF